MNWLKNLGQKTKEGAENRKMATEEKRRERIIVKCPLCKETIPSNALRCSHCTGDLSGKEAREYIEKQVEQRPRTNVIRSVVTGIVLFGIIFLIILISLVASDSQQSSDQSQEQQASVRIGDEGFLKISDDPNQILFLATTPEAFDKLIKVVLANDSIGLLELVAAGKVFGVTNGAKVKVIDTAFGRREVRILSGIKQIDQDKIGRSGWVQSEWVKSQ